MYGSVRQLSRNQQSTYVIYGPPANIIYLSLCFFIDRSRLFYKQLSTHKCSIKVAKDWIRNQVWYRKRPLCQLCKQPTDFMLVIQFFTQQTKHPRRRFCSIQVQNSISCKVKAIKFVKKFELFLFVQTEIFSNWLQAKVFFLLLSRSRCTFSLRKIVR